MIAFVRCDDELRNQIQSEIVTGCLILRVFLQGAHQEVSIEAIYAHGDEALVRIMGRGFGFRRFLLPADNAIIRPQLAYSEANGVRKEPKASSIVRATPVPQQ